MHFARRIEPGLRRLLWTLPPETAHTIAARCIGLTPSWRGDRNPRLATRLAGKVLPHPVGLAAGFDKSARMLGGLGRLGFSFVEAGTVTPKPQPGNPKPRLFRLPEDRGLINRFGFNNDGLSLFIERLKERPKDVVIGANIGINKTTDDPFGDFAKGLRACAGLADFVTINVSSPNTPGLRDLQEPQSLRNLLQFLSDHDAQATSIFLKLAPDLDDGQLLELVAVAIEQGIAGLILCNTATARPLELQSLAKGESGGLSGRPVQARAREVLKLVSQQSQNRLQLISVGGLFDGRDLFERLAAGAHAVQIYTSFIYEGPGIIDQMCEDLLIHMSNAGIANVSDLIGLDLRSNPSA